MLVFTLLAVDAWVTSEDDALRFEPVDVVIFSSDAVDSMSPFDLVLDLHVGEIT